MDTVIGGIFIAVWSAITFIAYRQQGDFQKISVVTPILLGIIIMLVASCTLGVTELRESVSWNDKFTPEAQVYIGNIADQLLPPHWIWPAFIALELYIVLLCFLCRFTQSGKCRRTFSSIPDP